MNFTEYVQKVLADFMALHDGNARAAAEALGVNHVTLWAWVTGKSKPSINQLSKVFEKLDIDFEAPISKNVKRPSFNIMHRASGLEVKPSADDYIAVPLVSDILPPLRDHIKDWILLNTSNSDIAYRKNIFALELNPVSAMPPLLARGDIVLIDFDDRDIQTPGNIMMVRSPRTGNPCARRVRAIPNGDDYHILFYDDKPHHSPTIGSLNINYEGKWDTIAYGRVIWAWTNMSGK